MLTFNLSEIKTAAAALGRVVPARPVEGSHCKYVRLRCSAGEAVLTATDSQLWLEVSLSAVSAGGPEDMGERDVLLPGRLFCDAVSRLQGEVLQLELDGSQVRVEAEGSVFLLNTAEPDCFPELPKPEGSSLEVPTSLLRDCVRRVAVCASSDITRGALCGVRMQLEGGALELVATDGYTLARTRMELPGGEVAALTVPVDGIQELVRLPAETVKLTFSQSYLLAEVPGRRLATRLLGGNYPGYRRLLPGADFQPKTKARLARKDLLEALSRVELVAKQDRDKLELRLEDSLVLSATAPDLGSATEVVSAQVEGEGIKIGVNLRYLSRFLGVAGDEVEVWLTAPNQALVWKTNTDPEYLYLLMPILLQ
jgi:DNA polymerase-3 subunit beta